MADDSSNGPRIALIIGSTRSPRVGPAIASLVHGAITSDAGLAPLASLELLDIANFHLPLFDEPGIPQQIRRSADYAHAHTRAWSAAVARYHAFVFLTPQYNWSVPAALKNAVDFLFHEFAGKPALVLSYGGRGGGRAADHLATICTGLRMRVLDESVPFAMHGHEGALEKSAAGVLFDEAPVVWKDQLDAAKRLYAVLVDKISETPAAGEGREGKA